MEPHADLARRTQSEESSLVNTIPVMTNYSYVCYCARCAPQGGRPVTRDAWRHHQRRNGVSEEPVSTAPEPEARAGKRKAIDPPGAREEVGRLQPAAVHCRTTPPSPKRSLHLHPAMLASASTLAPTSTAILQRLLDIVPASKVQVAPILRINSVLVSHPPKKRQR